MQKKQTYEQAMAALEQIVREMEQGSMGIDQLTGKIKDAQELIAFCREKLVSVEKEIQEIMPEEDK